MLALAVTKLPEGAAWSYELKLTAIARAAPNPAVQASVA